MPMSQNIRTLGMKIITLPKIGEKKMIYNRSKISIALDFSRASLDSRTQWSNALVTPREFITN